MTSAAARPLRLVVCGGSGFLGTRICKIASSRNWQVLSISRSGEPDWPSSSSSSSANTSARPEWAKKVDWRRGDVLNPETYRDAIKDADAVVHSMGILLEADYKGVLTGKEPVLQGLKKAFDSTRATGKNTIREGGKGLSYETMNRDSGEFSSCSPHRWQCCRDTIVIFRNSRDADDKRSW